MEFMAPVHERTGASLTLWPLCVSALGAHCTLGAHWALIELLAMCTSALGPHSTLGPCAGAHLGPIEILGHVHQRKWGLIELLGPVRDCTLPSLQSSPLCMSAPRPH